MTIEEKAKAYDEAVERAKKLIDEEGLSEGSYPNRDTCERIFPQLAESEDERIKNLIYCIVRDRSDVGKLLEANGCPVEKALAWLEKQKENPKFADSIQPNCVSDAKCEDRWYNVADSLPDTSREVICKDYIGNYFIGRYYEGIDGGNGWEVSVYDDEDKTNENNPEVVMWCEIPSEKQKEDIIVYDEDSYKSAKKKAWNSFSDKTSLMPEAEIIHNDGFSKGYQFGIHEEKPFRWIIHDEAVRKEAISCLEKWKNVIPGSGLTDYNNILLWLKEELPIHNGKQKEQRLAFTWRRVEDVTTKRTDEGDCVTTEKILVKGLIDDEDYRIVDKDVMVNKNLLCIPVRELNAEQKPVEWNAYDKATIEYIIEDIKELRDEETDEEVIETYNRELNLLQCINASVKLCNYTNPAAWSKEYERKIDDIIRIICDARECSKIANIGEEKEDNSAFYDELVLFLKSFRSQQKQEWSEEDEKWFEEIELMALNFSDDASYRRKFFGWLKSLRPQPKDNLAVSFMNYLDEHRPDGKMCLSNGECADIEKAFKEEDWAKVIRYINKYQPHWKPTKAMLDALNWAMSEFHPDCADIMNSLTSLYKELEQL